MEFGKSPESEAWPLHRLGPQTPVVVQAPSHDGAPCFSVHSTDSYHPFQPLYAIMIYATMPEAADPDFVHALALKIHTGTILERTERNYEGRDRIEVLGLPPPAAGATGKAGETDKADETEEACLARCIEHYTAEVAARTATGKRAFFLTPSRGLNYDRRLTIIRSLHAGWEDAALFRKKRERRPDGVRAGFGNPWDESFFPPRPPSAPDPLGTILDVRWQPTGNLRYYYETEEMQGLEPGVVPEQETHYVAVVRLAAQLADFRNNLRTLGCYVYEGELDIALRSGLAAATATKAKEARVRATAAQAAADAAVIEAADAAVIDAEAAAAKAEASWVAFSAALAAREEAQNVHDEAYDAAEKALERAAAAKEEVEAAAEEGDITEAALAELAVAEAEAAKAEAARDKTEQAVQAKRDAVKVMVTWMPAP